MPIIFKQKVAALDGNCEIDLAEELDLWLAAGAYRLQVGSCTNIAFFPHLFVPALPGSSCLEFFGIHYALEPRLTQA